MEQSGLAIWLGNDRAIGVAVLGECYGKGIIDLRGIVGAGLTLLAVVDVGEKFSEPIVRQPTGGKIAELGVGKAGCVVGDHVYCPKKSLMGDLGQIAPQLVLRE